ncbi:MAG: SGNH/GDSL hydrolase family protein [Holophagales bacterium]|nr:MAG: SGNH/GDSL hydrolase family protein [Holophagales bacterium]
MATKRTTPTKKASRAKARAAKRPAKLKAKSATKQAVAKRPVKKSAPASRPAKKRPATKPVRTSRALAPIVGPVSLEEAQALARASAPRAAARGLAPAPGPAPIGLARKHVAKAQQEELARRADEYKKVMAILKKRGVRGLAPAEGMAKPGARAAGVAGGPPLQILAEGDSWFDYPPHLLKGGIIPRLQKKLGVPILSLAKAGDEVRYMLGVKERKLLIAQLKKGCPAGGPWDALLFSGGGNDIVDNPMALWIRQYDPNLTAEQHIHASRFQTALDLVRAGYEDLIALRDELSPTTQLIFHGYDYAIPGLGGICWLGPWLSPTFDLRGFPKDPIRFEVVKVMLGKFFAMLGQLADPAKGITALATQGTLAPVRSSWHNELHPSNDGYDLFVDLFRKKLKELFPGRVL